MKCSRATRRNRRCTRTSPTASPPAASNTICRCFSTRPRHWSTTCRPTPACACTATSRARSAGFWQDTESRYRLLRGDKARPLLPPHELFLPEDAFNHAIKPFARIELSPPPGLRCRGRGSNRSALRAPTLPLPADPGRSPRGGSAARIEAIRHRYTRARAHCCREPRPPRNDAAVLRRVRLQAGGRRRLGGIRRRAMRARRLPSRRCTPGLSGRRPTSRSSPKPSSMRPPFAALASARQGAAMSTRCCATCRRCASAIRWSTSSTVSGAISA